VEALISELSYSLDQASCVSLEIQDMGTSPIASSKSTAIAFCLLSVTLSALALGYISPSGEEATSSPEMPQGAPVIVSEDEPVEELRSQVVGSLDFDPDVLNLRSHGKYVTGFLELPEGHPVREVFVPSIKLNDAVYAETCFGVQIFDTDNDGQDELMLKFIRADVRLILSPGDCVTVTVSGVMNDGTPITAADVIAVIGR